MTTSTVPADLPVADPRPAFLSAARTASDTVALVSPGQLADPTPCSEYDVRALLGHLVAVLHRVSALAAGLPAIGSVPPATGVPDDGWAPAARAAVVEVEAAWSDPVVLGREMRLPFGTLPGAAALAAYTGEVITHTWDLAVATGQTPDWDDDLLVDALAAVRSKLPADRGPGIPFAPAVPVPDDAPVIDRLVAWQGRDPHWRPRA
jgi:uncharacterized protein (TIGR03086 family)